MESDVQRVFLHLLENNGISNDVSYGVLICVNMTL